MSILQSKSDKGSGKVMEENKETMAIKIHMFVRGKAAFIMIRSLGRERCPPPLVRDVY